MKQSFITEVEQSLLSILDNAQMKALHEALTHALWGRDVVVIDSAEPVPEGAEQSKLAVKQSLEKLETLKKSLMQQYFG